MNIWQQITGTTFAFIVSLVGGLIIFVASIRECGVVSFRRPKLWRIRQLHARMHGRLPQLHGQLRQLQQFLRRDFSGRLGLRSHCFDRRPNAKSSTDINTIWAIIIIVFSVVSFVGMGGYFIGAILVLSAEHSF